MKWETIKISNNNKGKENAYASIGFGRITMSSASCRLIERLNDYEYVMLMKATDNKKLKVGVKLLKQKEENTIRIGKRKNKGEIVENSLIIDNKNVMKEIFGIQGTQNKVTNYSVELSPEDKTLLIINVE